MTADEACDKACTDGFSEATVRLAFEACGRRCRACGKEISAGSPRHVHHFTSLQEGGTNALSNCVFLCDACEERMLHAQQLGPLMSFSGRLHLMRIAELTERGFREKGVYAYGRGNTGECVFCGRRFSDAAGDETGDAAGDTDETGNPDDTDVTGDREESGDCGQFFCSACREKFRMVQQVFPSAGFLSSVYVMLNVERIEETWIRANPDSEVTFADALGFFRSLCGPVSPGGDMK